MDVGMGIGMGEIGGKVLLPPSFHSHANQRYFDASLASPTESPLCCPQNWLLLLQSKRPQGYLGS